MDTPRPSPRTKCPPKAAPQASRQLFRAPRARARLSADVFVRRYNRQEGLLDYLSERDLVTSFTDIVRPAPLPRFPLRIPLVVCGASA